MRILRLDCRNLHRRVRCSFDSSSVWQLAGRSLITENFQLRYSHRSASLYSRLFMIWGMYLADNHSLIAVMLGVLRMDVDTCIETYSSLARDIFPLEGWLSGSKLGRLKKAATGKQRFSPAPFEAAIKRLVAESTGVDETPMRSELLHTQSNHKCKV